MGAEVPGQVVGLDVRIDRPSPTVGTNSHTEQRTNMEKQGTHRGPRMVCCGPPTTPAWKLRRPGYPLEWTP
ncbi:hypothetical protein [Streptomyces sp. NPDC005953]|uniref:hypothetical protein n=1 Tax=Streptomyces sp. NPDC005953 TaxID=3156719 RepID=UPI0033E5337A